MSSKKTEIIGARVPINLRKAIREYVRQDTHLNESDFIRVAIREKLKRDAPHLIRVSEG